jgi:hypothetical protein
MGVTINTPDATSTATTNKSLSKKEIRSKFLSDFKARIDGQLDKLYLFYGRPYDFDSPNTGPLPEPIDSISDDASIRKAIMALKLIRPEDVTLAIRRIEWTTGTKVFTQYSNLIDLEDKDYYAFVKSQNKLYICLDNNNGATSVTEPNSSDGTPFTTADGYKWKLLIDYNSSVIRKFSATTHLPLPIKGSEQIKVSTTGGQIERLELTDDSPETIDYTDASPLLSEVPFFIKGDGDDVRTGRATFADTTNPPQVEGSALVSATITEAGTGYYNDSTRGTVPVEFRLTDPSTAGVGFKLAYGLATITNGIITALEVVNGGNGYPTSGTLTIVQSSAIAYATLDGSGDRITSTVIEKPGANFRTAKVVSIAGNAVSDAEDADSYIQPIISPFGGHGSNLQSELSATSLFLNIRVSSDTSEFTQTNDFRQIGIISNVKDTLGADIPDESIDATTSATLVAGAGMEFSSISADAIIEGRDSLHIANIVDLNETSTTTTMRYLNSQEVPYGNTFNNSEVVDFDADTNNKTGFTISNITKPTIDIFSGDILFINNNTAIQRNAEQTETLNFIFNF